MGFSEIQVRINEHCRLAIKLETTLFFIEYVIQNPFSNSDHILASIYDEARKQHPSRYQEIDFFRHHIPTNPLIIFIKPIDAIMGNPIYLIKTN